MREGVMRVSAIKKRFFTGNTGNTGNILVSQAVFG